MEYRIKRYYAYVVATIFSIVLPFITINGNHIFLLSFDKLQLHLIGTAFDMQELYLMPFILYATMLSEFLHVYSYRGESLLCLGMSSDNL